MAPALEHWQDLGFFEFLHLAVKLGFEFGRDYPGSMKIAEDFVSSKTFSIEKLHDIMLDHSQEHPDPGTIEFYTLLAKQAVENGELKSDISAETAALFTKSIIDNLGRLVIHHQFANPLGDEAENLYYEFISILRNGLAVTDH